MGANFTAKATFTAVDRTSATMRAMGVSTQSFASRATNAFARIERTSRRVTQAFSKMLGMAGKLGLGFGALMIARQIATANIELDNSLQSLQAITGVTGDAFNSFAKELDNVSKRQLIFAGNTAKAFELVGSAKPELLASAEALSKVTEAAIVLGKAGKLEVEDSVKSLTVSMNQFGAGAERASEFVDILATAQQKGSGTIQFLSEAMVNAGGTSKAFGNSFADTVAVLEGFAKAGVPASEAGTQLAGILAKLSTAQNKDFNPQFTKTTDIINNLAKENLSYTQLLKLTDVRGAKWLTTIINQNEVVQKLTGNLHDVGNAQSQANIQMSSLGNILNQIRDSFKNVITSTNTQSEQMLLLKKILFGVATNMGTILKVVGSLIAAFLVFKTIMIAAKIALVAYNIVLGISAALSGASAFAVHGNTIAYVAFRAAVLAGAAAQWVLNIAMAANPIGLIIIAIIILIALVVVIIKKWDQWGAALSLLLGPLGLIISIVQSFRKNWELVKASFASGGILKGLLTIGKVILDAILMPVQQLLELLGKIPGLSIATSGAEKIEGLRNRLFEQERSLLPAESKELSTTKATAAQENISREERITTQKATVNINNNTNSEVSVESTPAFPIQLSATN